MAKIKFKKYGPLDIEAARSHHPTAGGMEDIVMQSFGSCTLTG
jgi:hypothetical protein